MSFTAPDLSSLGGLHLLHGVNLKQGFLPRLCSHIQEWRNEDLIVHSIQEMVTQRVFQIQAGYEDADDCDSLRNDSMLKMCAGLLPGDHPLSSQPTMTRLENHVTHRELYEMGKEFVKQFIRSYKKAPSKIILVLTTATATHTARSSCPCSTTIMASIATCPCMYLKDIAAGSYFLCCVPDV